MPYHDAAATYFVQAALIVLISDDCELFGIDEGLLPLLISVELALSQKLI